MDPTRMCQRGLILLYPTCGQSLHQMVHLINLCMYIYAWKDYERSSTIPIQIVVQRLQKVFWGYLVLFALQLFVEKLSVTIKAVWEFNKHDPAVSLSPSEAFHASGKHKANPPKGFNFILLYKRSKSSNFPKAILYKTAFTYS